MLAPSSFLTAIVDKHKYGLAAAEDLFQTTDNIGLELLRLLVDNQMRTKMTENCPPTL